jgi:hypothetical protein
VPQITKHPLEALVVLVAVAMLVLVVMVMVVSAHEVILPFGTVDADIWFLRKS